MATEKFGTLLANICVIGTIAFSGNTLFNLYTLERVREIERIIEYNKQRIRLP